MGFKQKNADQCLYTRKEKNGNVTYILLYIDDLLVAGTSAEVTQGVSKELQRFFGIRDLGDINYYLGIQIKREADGSFLLSQKGKIAKLLEEYGLVEPKPMTTPMEAGFLNSRMSDSTRLKNNCQYRKAIGSLLYIVTVSRPDIALAVGILSRCVEKPTEGDWKAIKRIMRYLASTINKELRLSSSEEIKLECFVDADWADDKTDRKSTNGYVFRLGDNIIAWSSRKQTAVAM
ncbi:uncharacterized protein LOC113562800 [Ooceraea biroi]|uniref:uncharacterized protein LOC113562800 n=1 Tax=Ooceraea biroi TaxID=2015173 RepID=UPI000F08659C|nr:uncharacterized protein LOC113562800 [Ooceraea biroi]